MNSDGGDANFSNDSQIQTGPVQKPYNDDSEYEKGMALTGDKVFSRYRQDIPWFAVYSYGGRRSGGAVTTFENTNRGKIVTKKTVEEKIEDLVKRTKTSDVTEKDYNPKVAKLIDAIVDADLSYNQLNDLKKAIQDKELKKGTAKTLENA